MLRVHGLCDHSSLSNLSGKGDSERAVMRVVALGPENYGLYPCSSVFLISPTASLHPISVPRALKRRRMGLLGHSIYNRGRPPVHC